MIPTYRLSERLDSAAAPPLAADLLEHRGNSVCVDANAVRFIGTLPLQVLIAAKKQWHDDGHEFVTKKMSVEFVTFTNGLGVPLDAVGALEEDIHIAEADE